MAELDVESFRAMGSPCRVVVDGGPAGLAAEVVALIADLEARWSRFLPDSEVSQLNARPGLPTVVSAATLRLFLAAEVAVAATGGRFNPLLLDQLEQLGYRRPWSDGPPDPRMVSAAAAAPAEDRAVIVIPDIQTVILPTGTRFDPGGIGKGLAVDLAVEHCIEAGATTALVDLGGDLRVHGNPWYGPRWRIGVTDPFDDDREIAAFTPDEGAVTTSTTVRRSWSGPDGPVHHILDPVTGRPAATDLVAVTTCSSVAWWAEVAAKAALIAGSTRAADVLDQMGTPAIAVTDTGRIVRAGPVTDPAADAGQRPHPTHGDQPGATTPAVPRRGTVGDLPGTQQRRYGTDDRSGTRQRGAAA